MSQNKPVLLSDWLPTHPELLDWDSITGLSLAGWNTALRQTHAIHLSQGHEIEGISDAGTHCVCRSRIGAAVYRSG